MYVFQYITYQLTVFTSYLHSKIGQYHFGEIISQNYCTRCHLSKDLKRQVTFFPLFSLFVLSFTDTEFQTLFSNQYNTYSMNSFLALLSDQTEIKFWHRQTDSQSDF